MISLFLNSWTSRRHLGDESQSEKTGVFTPTERNVVEIALEQSGNLNALQRYRFDLQKGATYENGPMPIREFIKLETRQQYHSQLEEDCSKDPEIVTKKGFGDLRARILRQRRELWSYRSEFRGVLKRGIDLWRSDPSWYMHRVLVADCIRKQGCCSRGCGCCYQRQFDPQRKFEANHCTIGCRCCRLERDKFVVLTPEEEERTAILDDRINMKGFYHELEMASIWGLSSDSDCSPFDQIERSPECKVDAIEEHKRSSLYEWESDSTLKEET